MYHIPMIKNCKSQTKKTEIKNNNNPNINRSNEGIKPIKRHIEIKLEKNIYIEYKKESSLEDLCLIYNKLSQKEEKKGGLDFDEYLKKLKTHLTTKPIIKKFDEKSIKINNKYVPAENLREQDIIPDLFEEDDEDIKSLKQSLEKSIDKIFTHSLNDNLSEQLNDNSNNAGKNIINKLENMIAEDFNEDNEDRGDNYTYEEEDEKNYQIEQNEQGEQNDQSEEDDIGEDN